MRALLRLCRPFRRTAMLLSVLLACIPAIVAAQVPVQVRPGQQLPSPDQAREMLQNQPDLVRQLRDRLQQSGLTDDQIRARLRAAGYPENFLDQYLSGADTSLAVRPGPRTLDAVTALGILSPQELDSLRLADSAFAISDSLRQVLDSLRYLHLDSLRADSLADSLNTIRPGGLALFGVQTFRKLSTQFEPMDAGPVDENYRLGPGDALVLILTGDVEQGIELLDEVGVATVSGDLDPLSTGVVYCELVCALQGLAQYDVAEQWTEAMERWSKTNAIGSIRGRCRVHRAEILSLRGSCDEAEQAALSA
jgi:hypothetical protein